MGQFIGVEAGGTKFVCAYGSSPNDLHDITTIPTESPDITLPKVIDYIHSVQQKTEIKAIGLVCFGPLDLDRQSATYGHITSTPKPGWRNCNIVDRLNKEFNLPFGFDTDVNGAAIAEYYWGAAQGLSDFLYLTVGTGIGGGAMVNGKLLHGAMHPEMGHIFIAYDKEKDPFPGVCPYHHNCLEGLATGPSLKKRWEVNSALDLPPDHPGWDLEAYYLSQALANYTLILSPQRIIIGGGVMRQQHLLPKIRQQMVKWINGYVENPTLSDLDNYVVAPALSENTGVCGGIALGQQAFIDASKL